MQNRKSRNRSTAIGLIFDKGEEAVQGRFSAGLSCLDSQAAFQDPCPAKKEVGRIQNFLGSLVIKPPVMPIPLLFLTPIIPIESSASCQEPGVGFSSCIGRRWNRSMRQNHCGVVLFFKSTAAEAVPAPPFANLYRKWQAVYRGIPSPHA